MKCLTILLFALFATTLGAQTAPKEPAKCIVQGQVVQEPGGQPLKKVNIKLVGTGEVSEERASYAAITDAEGHFKIEDVKPGDYRLFLERSGFLEADKHRHRSSGVGMSLSLQPGQEVKDLIFQMQSTAVITGKVVDSDGDPVPNVFISVRRYSSASDRHDFRAGGFERTNDLGEYRVGALRPGRYIVEARPNLTMQPERNEGSKEETIYAPTYYPGTADRTEAVPLELHSGEEVTANLSLATTRAFHVRGTVSGSTAMEGAVMLQAKDEAFGLGLGVAEINKDGSFDIPGVLPGTYRIRVMTAASGFPEMALASQTIEVTSADVDGVRVMPIPAGQVRGQFRMDANQQKIDWSKLAVLLDSDEDTTSSGIAFSGEEAPTYAQVKSDGSFEMKKTPAGAYHVLVTSSDPKLRDYFLKSVNLSGRDVGDNGFAVAAATYSLDLVVSAYGAAIEGTVVDAKDHPVADATVVCVPDAKRRKRSDLYQQDTTDQHGHFRLHGLNPGEYTVLAFEELDDDYHDPDFIKAYQTKGETVEIEEGGSKSVQVKVIPAAEEQP